MKEYLLKTNDGKYHYYRDDMDCCPKHVEKIEIPEDCNFVTIIDKKMLFWLYSGLICCLENGGISAKYKPVHDSVMEYLNEFYGEARIIWERKNHTMKNIYISGSVSIKGNLSVEGTLAERQKTYGCFEDVATVTEEIIKALKIGNYDNMPKPHKMAMYMIASKMARLVNGDFNSIDGWHDIGGYSKLIENLIGGENE